MAKAGGFFFIVFGVTALMGALVQINPVWLYGPYNPSQITAGSQPDWYIGFLDGVLRIMPNWETSAFGSHDQLEHPRPGADPAGHPVHGPGRSTRSSRRGSPATSASTTCSTGRATSRRAPALGVMAITFYGVLWIAGGNDIIATHFDLSINAITWFCRIGGLRRCRRSPSSSPSGSASACSAATATGCCTATRPASSAAAVTVSSSRSTRRSATRSGSRSCSPAPRRSRCSSFPAVDENGVRAPGGRVQGVRAALSRWYFSETIPDPTPEELHDAAHHAQELAEHQQRQLDSGPS